jgi:hypothetical protein
VIRERGIQCQSIERRNPLSLCVKRGRSFIVGFNGGWISTIDAGALGNSGTSGNLGWYE